MNSLKTTLTKKISKVALSLLALNLVFTSGITAKAATVTPAAAGATVSYVVTGDLKVGNIIDIALKVDGATDLYGASWDLAYDKSFLEVQSVTTGSIFPTNVNVPVNKPKTVPGLSELAMTLTGSAKATGTSGTIATMKVKILKEGSVTLKSSNSDAALVATGLNARVKLATSAAANIAYTSTDKVINVGSITSKLNSFAANKVSALIGDSVVFTADATPAVGSVYEFYIKKSTTTVWSKGQNWSSKNTLAWKPTAAGTYNVRVRVRHTSSPNKSDDYKDIVFVVKSGVEQTSKLNSLVPSTASGKVGTSTAFTANATPATGSLFEYYIKKDTAADWSKGRNWSSNNIMNWKPTTAGNYTIRVRVKNVNSPNKSDDYKDIKFVVAG